MNGLIKWILTGAIIIAPAQDISAQYRDFTNTKGQSISALPWKKTDDGIIVKTNTGKTHTLKFAILSQDDIEFLKTWKQPELSHQVKEHGRPAPNAQTQADQCMVEIFHHTMETNDEGKEVEQQHRIAAFGAKAEREIEQAVNMFAGILRHKEKFIEKNSVMGKKYDLQLSSFNKKFPEGMSWSISVNDETLTLYGRDRGSNEVSVHESQAPYLLDYLTDIDADRMIKSYIRIKNRN